MLRRVTHALSHTAAADQARALALRIAGLAAAVQAGFTVNTTAGWTVLAAGLFVLEWSVEAET